MSKLKTLSLITIFLLLQSCSSKPRKYNMVGFWKSDCVTTENYGNYKTTSIYEPDGSFQAKLTLTSTFFGIPASLEKKFYSGTYKNTKSKLETTITNVVGESSLYDLPLIDEYDLEWINDNSVLISGGDKCTAIRLTNN